MSEDILDAIVTSVGLAGDASSSIEFNGLGGMPSVFRVTDFAAATVGAAGLAIAALASAGSPNVFPPVSVDRRLASFWFATTLRPQGWDLPPLWDPIAGDYEARDGWIRLHTNAPHHRAAALKALGVDGERSHVAAAVSQWSGAELETAVVEAGGCAAVMHSFAEWAAHPQGKAVASEPLAYMDYTEPMARAAWPLDPERPLQGIRILDLTRILAGPVATRFLAGCGADVLRIDPVDWDEPAAIPEVSPGKRLARLDLKRPDGLARLRDLISEADVMVHGYRSDALERLGVGREVRRDLQPGLIDVSLDAFGWTGPWAQRRGFDSLVQMSSGLAEAGMRTAGTGKPFPLPVQALDHGTGYLMAAAVGQGLLERATTGRALTARFSLARTAALLARFPDASGLGNRLAPETSGDLSGDVEQTTWGPAKRLLPALEIAGAPFRWDLPAGNHGRDNAGWAC